MTITVALVGRPNVGKSSLFNLLVGKQMALVHNTPGLTRDYKVADGHLGSIAFTVMDTAGLEEDVAGDEIRTKMQQQTLSAVMQADVIVFMIDGQEGITSVDSALAQKVREWNKPVILVVNKSDDKRANNTALDSFSLGLGEPILLSAAHNQGLIDLADVLLELMPQKDLDAEKEKKARHEYESEFTEELTEEDELFQEDPDKPIKIAIVGRPNVGKSTLLNEIIGEDRAITSPIAGTTRDAVMVQWMYQERPFRLVDTAGLRKHARIVDKIEKMSANETIRAIRLAHVVVLVLDAELALDHQDQSIADHVIQEGRALILAVNKWDKVKNGDEYRKELRERLGTHISQVKDIPMVTLSALHGKNVDKLLDGILNIYSIWQRRISTSKLNRWIENIEAHNPPPMASGRANRMRYMTQIKSNPPTFALWVSRPDDMPDSYHRYLLNNLRKDFDLPGIPIRLYFRSSKNPFAGEKKK